MKRFVLLFALVVLPTLMIGCGDDSPPPAGTRGTGPDTGPPTKGEAQKDRENMFKRIDENVAKSKAAVKKR
jgi:hypothetical protein